MHRRSPVRFGKSAWTSLMRAPTWSTSFACGRRTKPRVCRRDLRHTRGFVLRPHANEVDQVGALISEVHADLPKRTGDRLCIGPDGHERCGEVLDGKSVVSGRSCEL